jgi:hypothetical protein
MASLPAFRRRSHARWTLSQDRSHRPQEYARLVMLSFIRRVPAGKVYATESAQPTFFSLLD